MRWTAKAALALLAVTACPEAKWEAAEALRAPDHAVAAALGDLGHGTIRDLDAADVPDIAAPQSLRPCCAFGTDLQVKVGSVPVPGIELANLIGLEEIGPHGYDNGLVSLDATDTRGWVDDEKNGLVYTCRGGFIDTAHIRDNADLTLYLAAQVGRKMERGGSIALPDQGGTIRARLKAVDPELLERYGRRKLAIPMAQWLAFQMSIWHEIATWYGYASMAAWPEKISAFSPEDLYSNLLGTKIAGGIIFGYGAASDYEYNRSMDAWIRRSLERLEAVPQDSAQAAMRSVDGAWWDSGQRVPDWNLVIRRNMHTGTEISPWLVSQASAGDDQRFRACEGKEVALVLRNPDGFEGLPFRNAATIEIEVSESLAAGFPFPEAGSRRITQAHFPAIIEVIRQENAEVFGESGDRP